MATIFIIAGPPGIGKSSSGSHFIPEGVNIIDPDDIAQRYRRQGFTDYKDIGNIRFQDTVRKALFSDENFAVELNLGFQSHYDFLKSLRNFNPTNRIAVILFYTDYVQLCITRAALRYKYGLHLVPAETIYEMYNQTFSLLKKHFNLINHITFVNVSDTESPMICAQLDNHTKELLKTTSIPKWFANHEPMILNHLEGS